MASQRLIVTALGGEAATQLERLFMAWRGASPDVASVDHFCQVLQANARALHFLYYSEWIDRWLMGNDVPGPHAIEGRQFQVAGFTRDEALNWAQRTNCRHAEHAWFAQRLREAADAWPRGQLFIVVVREVFGGSATDEEIEIALRIVPTWIPHPPE